MSIKGLLTSGSDHRGTLEKVADNILSYPRAMWRGKKISIVENGANYQINKLDEKKRNRSINECIGNGFCHLAHGLGGGVEIILLATSWLATSILSLPFLGVGLALKKIALATDNEANNYHKFVEKVLTEKNIESKLEKAEKAHKELSTKVVEYEPILDAAKKSNLKSIKVPVGLGHITIDDATIDKLRKKMSQIEQSIENLRDKQYKAAQETHQAYETYAYKNGLNTRENVTGTDSSEE